MTPEQRLWCRNLAAGNDLYHVHRKTGNTAGPYHVANDNGNQMTEALAKKLETAGFVAWEQHERYPGVEVMTLTEQGLIALQDRMAA